MSKTTTSPSGQGKAAHDPIEAACLTGAIHVQEAVAVLRAQQHLEGVTTLTVAVADHIAAEIRAGPSFRRVQVRRY